MSRTWIVGYDFSTHADRAVEHATRRLEGFGGGRLIVLHAHPAFATHYGIDGYPSSVDVDVDAIGSARQAIADRLATISAVHPTVTLEARVELGAATDVIASLCAQVGAEQVVVGSRGLRGLDRFFLGSVAERVVRAAPVPVLVVKEPPAP